MFPSVLFKMRLAVWDGAQGIAALEVIFELASRAHANKTNLSKRMCLKMPDATSGFRMRPAMPPQDLREKSPVNQRNAAEIATMFQLRKLDAAVNLQSTLRKNIRKNAGK